MFTILLVLILLILSIYLFLQQEKFGKKPSGERLKKIQQSPHYNNGSFQNISHTPNFTEGIKMTNVLKEMIFNRNKNAKPSVKIPSIKTNLKTMDPKDQTLIWFGHSSYFIQIDGVKILVDPVFSGAASPIASSVKAFEGSNIYSAEDMPEIDLLLITHDHWDHLDYDTVKKLKPKIKKIITGLGTAEHLEHWGFDPSIIIEKDWNEKIELENNFIIYTTSARHFSGRGLKRNQAIWLSFVLQTPSFNLFIGGDSGYDKHFEEIGKKFGPFDLVILENGQYDYKWKYIHMLPEDFMMAAKELNAKKILPVHASKFALANHAWNEPLERLNELNIKEKLNIITPQIGEIVDLKDDNQTFTKWWKSNDLK